MKEIKPTSTLMLSPVPQPDESVSKFTTRAWDMSLYPNWPVLNVDEET